MRHSSPPPPPPTWSHAAGLRLSPPTPSVILAANLARVVCCLSFGSKLAKRQDAHGEAGQDEGRRQSWQTASSLSLATLIALRQRGESSQSACACIARMGKRNGTSGSGSGYILAKCSWCHFWPVAASRCCSSRCCCADGVQKAQKKSKEGES